MTDAKSDTFRIGHMLDACRDAREFAGSDREEFMRSKLRQAATVRSLQILGDAAKAVGPDTRYRFDHVPWRGVAGMRDMVVHEYFDVQLDTVWEVVSERLPDLERDLARMLDELEDE